MSVQAAEPFALALVDPQPLRGAALSRLLEEAMGGAPPFFRLVELPAEGCPPAGARVAILSLGGAPLRAPEQLSRLRDLRSRLPEAALVVLAESEATGDVVAALQAGARGYMTFGMEPRVLFSALVFVAAGGCFFPPAALLAAQHDTAHEGAAPPDCGQDRGRIPCEGILTTRQTAVLRFLQQGQSNKQIGRALGMNEATVKVHMRQIMRKLGVTNRTQAVLSALERGLAPEGTPAAMERAALAQGELAETAGAR